MGFVREWNESGEVVSSGAGTMERGVRILFFSLLSVRV